MPIDPVLAAYSDDLYLGAVAVYVIAMFLHAFEFVGNRKPMRAKTLVATSGDEVTGSTDETPGPAERVGRTRSDKCGRMGVSVTIVGLLLHVAAIVLRGFATERWPLGNMYEFTSAICLAAVVCWLVVLRRSPSLRPVGAFVLPPVLILMFLGGTVLYANAAPVVPALQSYWLAIHVTTVTIASGLLMVAGVASILYLLVKAGKAGRLAAKLPGVDALDRLAYRVTVVGFPIYTFAVIAGAIWAESAWGRFWGWDPKETVAFVAWVVYAAYLHARATSGWRTTGAPWINVVGFATIVFNLFFINMVVAGLHSYAGLS
ncbi:MAG: c-type cytochrome biogenesis protein CcsB [Pseudonocardia sp.]|uniref:c-type cytochrome biogenesis protein CcsB n=1 Tax=unclassified Pseudonocardia TaxID=2619320 RepID=UPI00086EE929|nr:MULTISPECIES: c-type cytochrome biogenesis protein CcsB [unclassified Pseudonocardia]MBN9108964.1 c-type cytochrome biogenesis protein CcsB [Pseudonocardia sp.]ODU21837.1 MAG: c-type cytochrome biogenesis protein CcsB [Pseudonocardia sp. SCN 72-51]ODU99225.1 MAG: c-type cytochrome biogenesis protein CcsB [Pseudonocardia sp. SCN 73-27]